VDRFNAEFLAFRAEMARQTGGEGHAIKKLMELVGLAGGPSRPPTRYVPMAGEQRTRLAELLRERIMTG